MQQLAIQHAQEVALSTSVGLSAHVKRFEGRLTFSIKSSRSVNLPLERIGCHGQYTIGPLNGAAHMDKTSCGEV